MSKTFTTTEISTSDLTATDLREEAEGVNGAHAYRIAIYDEAGVEQAAATAEALTIEDRTGIAWGADAAWGDSFGTIDQDVECWLNDNGTWADRN